MTLIKEVPVVAAAVYRAYGVPMPGPLVRVPPASVRHRCEKRPGPCTCGGHRTPSKKSRHSGRRHHHHHKRHARDRAASGDNALEMTRPPAPVLHAVTTAEAIQFFRQLAKVLELQHLINSAYNAGAGRRRVQSAQSAAPSPQISAGESSRPSMSTATEYKEVRPASLLQPVGADVEAELPQ